MLRMARVVRGGGMALLCQAYGLPQPEAEYRFDASRRWRFDFAWPDRRLAVEQEGGIWTNGRHTRGRGYLADLEKYNAATLAGWRVLRFTPEQINAGHCLNTLIEALK